MSVVSFYNRISPFYPLVNFFLKGHKKKLVREINLLPPGKLLEVGVGSANYLNSYQKHNITAIDNSKGIIETAKKNTSDKITFLEMSAEELNFANSTFDYVILSHLLSINKNPNVVLEECKRVLKKGGLLIVLNHFTPDNPIAAFDYLFQPIAKLFYFNSYFKMKSLTTLEKLRNKKILQFGLFNEYKLLILEKVD